MTKATHLASGLLTSCVAIDAYTHGNLHNMLVPQKAVETTALSLVILLGSVFPDYDLGYPFKWLFKHRTYLHWFPIYLALFAAGAIARCLYLIWFSTACLLHLLLDATTVMGVPGIKYPRGDKFTHHGLKLVHTGSLADRLTGAAFLLGGCIYAWIRFAT